MQSARILAIAVLMIVIAPIGVGYLMAFDEVEREGWRTVDQYNLSDQILNAESPYYLPSTSPANNGLLRDGNSFVSPDYVTVSTTPSSIPTYTANTFALDSSTLTSSASVNASAVNLNEGGTLTLSGGSSSATLNGFAYRISCSAGFNVVSNSTVVGEQIAAVNVVQETTDSGVQWSIYNGTVSNAMNRKIGVYPNATLSVASGSAASITIAAFSQEAITATNWIVRASGSPLFQDWNLLGLRLQMADGSVYMHSHSGGLTAMGAGSTVTISAQPSNKVFTSVVSVQYVLQGSASISISEPATGQYADPADGWRFPSEGSGYRSSGVWTNGQVNESVTMYVNPATRLGNVGITYTVGTDVLYLGTAGHTLNGESINWPASNIYSGPLQIIFSIDTIKITVIEEWPPMYGAPVTYGSVTVDRANPQEITYISVAVQDYNQYFTSSFRVDATNIRAGFYPSTEDATLDIDYLFGKVPFSLELSSVGVYGDALRVGGESYPVTDGAITVDGQTFRVLDLKIGIVPGDGSYIITLNGVQIQEVTSYPTVGFTGKWSLAVRGWSMESFTSVSREWIPGEYALDEGGAALVGVITCIGVFVALALVRPFSGGKMLMLAIICGGGLMLFLIML